MTVVDRVRRVEAVRPAPAGIKAGVKAHAVTAQGRAAMGKVLQEIAAVRRAHGPLEIEMPPEAEGTPEAEGIGVVRAGMISLANAGNRRRCCLKLPSLCCRTIKASILWLGKSR